VRACDRNGDARTRLLLIESDAGGKVKNSGQWSVVSGQKKQLLLPTTDRFS
jgi:hypothetical protein